MKEKLVLIIALCHSPGRRIRLKKLIKWTAAAWDLARHGNKTEEFNKNVLSRMAVKTDT